MIIIIVDLRFFFEFVNKVLKLKKKEKKNKQKLIPLALVGYEMIIVNKNLRFQKPPDSRKRRKRSAYTSY